MNAERYQKLHRWFDAHPAAKHGVILLDHWLPLVPFVCYPVLLCLLNVGLVRQWMAGQRWSSMDSMRQTAHAILVPGITFWLGTVLRAKLNRPRPYEQPGFEPLVQKKTQGHSCPSRHALSAAVLAMVWLHYNLTMGCIMLAVAAAICVLRVLTGVHSVQDVVCGAAMGLVMGYVGMWLM